ncbi:fibronectin type III domain-containing protein [Methanocorpusculum sp.]
MILLGMALVFLLFSAGVSADLPTISTLSCDGITAGSCTFQGNLQKNGGFDVTDVGFVYGTSPSDLAFTVSEGYRGHSYGKYSTAVSGLAAGTTYYYRAYAVNQEGTAYGPVMSFTTTSAGPGPFSISAPYQNQNCVLNDGNCVNAQWSAAPGAAGYRVTLRDMTTNMLCFSNLELGNATSYAIPSENLTAGHEYCLSICAYSNAGDTCQERYFSVQAANGVTATPVGSANQYANQYQNARILDIIAESELVPGQAHDTSGLSTYRYTFTVRTNPDADQVCLYLYNGTNSSLIGVNSTYAVIGSPIQMREFTFTRTMLWEEAQNMNTEACIYYDGQPIRDRDGAYKVIAVSAPGQGNTSTIGNTNQFMDQIMNFFRNMFSWNFGGSSGN